MKVKDIKPDGSPFRPFTIHMNDKFFIYVPHQDYIFFPPGGDNVVVVDQANGIHVISINHITRIEHSPA